MKPLANIIRVDSAGELAAVKELFVEYAQSLHYHICFESFEKELARLPGEYAPPAGTILLAKIDELWAGCAALKPIAPGVAELKRLYVRPAFRGSGTGRQLANEIVRIATDLRYESLRLDTLPTMTAARALYASLGFRELPSPAEGPIDMELSLTRD